MTIENVLSVLSLLGVGGLLGAYSQALWERKNTILLQKQEFKETRYKCIILLLLARLDFEKEKKKLHRHGRGNLKNISDLNEELTAEYYNMILYASEEVLTSMSHFLDNPNKKEFQKVTIEMRNDLWGGKLSSDFIKNLDFK